MENIIELTECYICKEMLTDPRMLQCIHTFCLKCLEHIASASQEMLCPICRKEFSFPENGMAGLQKNFFMERMIEITKLSKPLEQAIFCEMCMLNKKVEATKLPPAISFCIECHAYYCSHCCQNHDLLAITRLHQIIQIGNQVPEDLVKKYGNNSCDKHSDTTFKLYCWDCKQAICTTCCLEDHRYHRCLEMEKVAGEFRHLVIEDVRRMESWTEKELKRTKQVVNEKKKFMMSVKEANDEILNKQKELKDLVDKCTQSLLNELALARDRGLRQFDNEDKENENTKMINDSLKAYGNAIKTVASDAEICQSFHYFHSRADEVEQLHKSQREIPSIKVSFEPTVMIDDLFLDNILGRIENDFIL